MQGMGHQDAPVQAYLGLSGQLEGEKQEDSSCFVQQHKTQANKDSPEDERL